MTEVSKGRVRANNIDFHYLEAGSGPLILCLHGFPDNPHTYHALIPQLVDAGYRVVAPYMRGYAPTGVSPDGRYEAALLGLDASALIDELGGGRAAAVIGHDWGAFATYAVAAFSPEKREKIVTIAIAHPGALLGELGLNYDVIKGGWHAYFFQMPGAEQAIAHNDFDFLLKWWQDASPEFEIPREVMEGVKETFRQEGTVEAAVNYYRHTFNPAGKDPTLAELSEKIGAPTTLPCLAFHGTRDRPGRLETFENMDHLFTNKLEKVVIERTGHFMHLEQPEMVNNKIIQFLTH